MDKKTLSLAELELFDPQAQPREGERRFLCPFCGADKPHDAAHRSLCLNGRSGLWNCKRCAEKGRLHEMWDAGESRTPRKRAQMALKRAFELPAIPQGQSDTTGDFGTILALCGPLNAAAQNYLHRRAIEIEVAERAGVQFCPSWHGRATLVFPFRNPAGETVAIAGRALRDGGVDKPALGPKKRGAFWAPTAQFKPLDAALPAVLLCEAPFDALSLAQAGFPALAFGGTAPPQWLAQKCAFRRVLLAFDADDAGEGAAEKIGALLASFGARCERLRPEGAKDWNELLQKAGREAVEDLVAPPFCRD